MNTNGFTTCCTLRPQAMASITFEPLHLSIKRSIHNSDPHEKGDLESLVWQNSKR